MIVVADTSPLNYLIQIECDGLLHSLYGRVLVPLAVMSELKHTGAPDIVHAWLRRLPLWIDIGPVIAEADKAFASLDPGEREAIQLEEHHADLLLIDERKGRIEARRRGLVTTGTLGVLVAAGDMGLIEPEKTYERLISMTTFRSTPGLHASFLEVVRSRRKNG